MPKYDHAPLNDTQVEPTCYCFRPPKNKEAYEHVNTCAWPYWKWPREVLPTIDVEDHVKGLENSCPVCTRCDIARREFFMNYDNGSYSYHVKCNTCGASWAENWQTEKPTMPVLYQHTRTKIMTVTKQALPDEVVRARPFPNG